MSKNTDSMYKNGGIDLDSIINVTLFASSLSPEINAQEERTEKPGKKTAQRAVKTLKCSGQVNIVSIPEYNSARYTLNAFLVENEVKINFKATYFILLQKPAEEYSATDFEGICVNLGRHIIWPKYRDLSALIFAQSGWQTAQLPVKACEFQITEINLREQLKSSKSQREKHSGTEKLP